MKQKAFLILTILGIILVSGCVQQSTSSNPSYTDVEISDFKWSACDKEGDTRCYEPPILNANDGLIGEGNLILYSSKERIYAMVYANGRPLKEYTNILKTGENKVHAWNIKLDSFYSDVKFKACFSQEPQFTESSDNVICKERSFPSPKISVSVSPNPLRLTIYKNGTDIPRSEVTVTNTGSVPLYIYALLPSYAAESLNYPKNNPQYVTFGFSSIPHAPNSEYRDTRVLLASGESAKLDIGVLIGNVGEFNTPLGTYTSTGYIWSLSGKFNTFDNALFKEEFMILTEVK